MPLVVSAGPPASSKGVFLSLLSCTPHPALLGALTSGVVWTPGHLGGSRALGRAVGAGLPVPAVGAGLPFPPRAPVPPPQYPSALAAPPDPTRGALRPPRPPHPCRQAPLRSLLLDESCLAGDLGRGAGPLCLSPYPPPCSPGSEGGLGVYGCGRLCERRLCVGARLPAVGAEEKASEAAGPPRSSPSFSLGTVMVPTHPGHTLSKGLRTRQEQAPE